MKERNGAYDGTFECIYSRIYACDVVAVSLFTFVVYMLCTILSTYDQKGRFFFTYSTVVVWLVSCFVLRSCRHSLLEHLTSMFA